VYLGASRFNHSCLPNCTFVRDGDRLVVTAHAEIEPDAECTIDYLSEGSERTIHSVVTNTNPSGERRRAHILARRGFDCACHLCVRQACEHRPPIAKTRACDACSAVLVGDIFSRCSRCKIAYCCDAACQKRHWKLHHKVYCRRYS
jgi:hypothetical protein